MKAAEALEMLQDVRAYIEIAKELTPIIYEIGNVAKPIINDAQISLSDMKTNVFNNYISNGFSREEAMVLTIDQEIGISKAVKAYNKNKN